jgi:hypothetical protein
MKTKIKEVQDYFAQKIYNCDFKIIKSDENFVEILIDDKFNFSIWKIYCETYNGVGGCFMELNLDKEKTLKSIKWVNDNDLLITTEAKTKEYNKLKKELNL